MVGRWVIMDHRINQHSVISRCLFSHSFVAELIVKSVLSVSLKFKVEFFYSHYKSFYSPVKHICRNLSISKPL